MITLLPRGRDSFFVPPLPPTNQHDDDADDDGNDDDNADDVDGDDDDNVGQYCSLGGETPLS